MRTFLPTVCKLRRYHHHSFNINLKTDSIWYHTRNWDWSIPERCSRKPWRENMPSRPSTSTTWNRCRPLYRPASKPRRPSSCRFERSTQVCEPDHPALHGTGSRGVCQGAGQEHSHLPPSRPRRHLRTLQILHRHGFLVGHDRR